MLHRRLSGIRAPQAGRLIWGVGLALCCLLDGRSLPAQGLQRMTAKEVESSFDEARTLSGPQKLDQSESRIGGMKGVLKRAYATLREARDEKDVVRMNCVNQKLTAQKGLLKISEQALIQLQEAVSQRDDLAANHEYTKIAIAGQKMQGLGIETEGCAGEALRYIGNTEVDVEISEAITKDDPTVRDEVAPILDNHPESASFFQ